MKKGFDSSFHHQHFDQQSPNLNSFDSQFNLLQQDTIPSYMSPYSRTVLESWTCPVLFSGLLQGKENHTNEPHRWFCCLPHFRQGFAPMPNFVSKEKPFASLDETCGGIEAPNTLFGCGVVGTPNVASGCGVVGAPSAASGSVQRRFLVFDQLGDGTTLIFGPGMRAPVQCLASLHPKLPVDHYSSKDDQGMKRKVINPPNQFLMDTYDEGVHGNDIGSEMREDTEELNALLYSDDDNDYFEDDEVTSMGHLPSTMTTYDKQEWSEESGEEVASSAGPMKRQKLSDGRYDVLPLADTASSVKRNRCFEYEDDAESGCGDGGNNQEMGELGSLFGNKRSRNERIRETLNILQSIIPGGKGKDAVEVLDEAIHYLRSLKLKAKALGLDAL